MKPLVLAVLSTLALACSTGRPALQPAPPTAPGPKITFLVHQANKLPLEELSGVTVIVVGREGRTELGHTFGGRFTMEKSQLRKLAPEFVVFCPDGFWCAAVDAGAQRSPSLFDFDEYRVDLATITMF